MLTPFITRFCLIFSRNETANLDVQVDMVSEKRHKPDHDNMWSAFQRSFDDGMVRNLHFALALGPWRLEDKAQGKVPDQSGRDDYEVEPIVWCSS